MEETVNERAARYERVKEKREALEIVLSTSYLIDSKEIVTKLVRSILADLKIPGYEQHREDQTDG